MFLIEATKHCSISVRYVILAGDFSIVAQHYEWPYKMHSLLPLVARKLANECDTISRSVADLFTSSHPQHRQWRSQCESPRIERLKRRTDRDVIPVFNLLIFRQKQGGLGRGGASGYSHQVIVSHAM